MNTDSQAATLDFLTNPHVHGVPADKIVQIHTHISVVVLAGARAYKLKKAIRLPYIDLSTAARRLASCQRELELNRLTAPELYLAVRRIMREHNGQISFDGAGEMIDAAVEMRRFPDDALLEAIVRRGRMTTAIAEHTASVIASFHDHSPIVQGVNTLSALAEIIAMTETLLVRLSGLPVRKLEVLFAALRDELKLHAPLLARRAEAGKVRHCHGDLHLRNICVINGIPILFDCLEFDDSLATIDVLYDLAFLIMDLRSQGLPKYATLVMNRYLDISDDEGGMALMPLFMSLRAAIRAQVLCAQAAESAEENRASLLAKVRNYVDTAVACLVQRTVRLVAIGGLSGSGKSSLAAAIAHDIGPAPGARVLSSDRIRKRLCGVTLDSTLPDAAYRAELSEQVYAEQAARAGLLLRAGCAVIADAAFEREDCRRRIERCADHQKVPFHGFWLQAPPATLFARVGARTNDPSDANERIVRMQLDRQRVVKRWTHIDAQGSIQATAACVLRRLEE